MTYGAEYFPRRMNFVLETKIIENYCTALQDSYSEECHSSTVILLINLAERNGRMTIG